MTLPPHHRVRRCHSDDGEQGDEPGGSIRDHHGSKCRQIGGRFVKTRVERSRSREVEETVKRGRQDGETASRCAGETPASVSPATPASFHPSSVTQSLSPWRLRWRTIDQVSREEVREAVYGWTLYLAAAVVVLVGVTLAYNNLRSVSGSGLEIVSRPFFLSILVATSIGAVYLAAWAALAIARPRDQGALRVLFFAPIDPVGLIGAHLVAAIGVYIVFMILILPLFAILAALTNLPLPAALFAGVLVSPALVAPAIGIGLFISAIASSARSAVFLFAAALALVLAAQIGYSALLQIPPTSRYYDALLFLRDLLRVVRETLQWVSPLALLSQGLDAAFRGSWRELLLYVASGIGGATVWLALAIWALPRRGVLP